MNSRGQAALEYLMTYGWALIVIAIVVGVLVFIVATPTGGINCTSSSPGKINVVSNNFRTDGLAADIGDVVITNLTAGKATAVTIAGTGMFAPRPMGATYTSTATGTLPIGDTKLADVVGVAATNTSGTMEISYIDPSTLTQTTIITCQGATVTYT